MAQIVTVSPVTAAYASQAYKTTARAATLFEQKIEAWTDAARVENNFQVRGYLTVVQPPALALAFLTQSQQPDVTQEMAARLYAENAGAAADPGTAEALLSEES